MLIADIVGDKLVSGFFLIVENQIRIAKNGSNYLALKLGDRSGEIAAKVWSATEELFFQLEVGKVIKLNNIQAKNYKDQLQLEWDAKSSESYQVLNEEEVDYSQFLPRTPGNLTDYWNYINTTIQEIKDPILKRVLKSFFGDKQFVANFLRVPAGLKRHHAYIGGLAEHTAGVLNLSLAAANYYPMVNKELLVTGAILHDIGKTKTYKIDRGIDGSDEGRLIGHLVLGAQMVDRAFDEIMQEFDPEIVMEVKNQLIHLLVSHHGIMEWGSPIEPLMIEACILHHADNMDAQTTKFLTIMRQHRKGIVWAAYDTGLGRSIYLGKQLINDPDDE
jgi:3'-5' exoribonuclease